jgi:hypothetical protein
MKKKVLKDYNKLHKKFFKELCTFGSDHKYYKMLRAYQGQGHYLPELNGDIDVNAIKTHLPMIKDKESWLKDLVLYLKKKKTLPQFKKISSDVKKLENELLKLKKQYQLSANDEQRAKTIEVSRKKLEEYKIAFKKFISKIPFLLSYRHPVDHYNNRKEYDRYKDLGSRYKGKANAVYFMRKIYEDGALDPDNRRADSYLRSTIDTVTINVERQRDFISENVRYDMEYVYKAVENSLKRGYKKHLARTKYWLKKTKQKYNYYKDIIAQSKEISQEAEARGLSKTQYIMKKKAEATFALKNYVLEKNAKTYKFWSEQNELMKSLFAIETILFNEVGGVDGRDAVERDDVAQVVINRFKIPFYQRIENNDPLYPYLKKYMTDAQIQKEHWLNVLFKVGEFSFTYYYIPGSVHIFCPDQSRAGRFLRKENLKLAISKLKSPDFDFRATRYFSRASMRGRIDMSKIWSGYSAIAERAGPKISKQRKWEKILNRGKFKYLYSFVDPEGKQFQVLKYDKDYVTVNLDSSKPNFYKYRNPHLFTYFVKE